MDNGIETSDGNKNLTSTNVSTSNTTVLDQLSNLDNKETSWKGSVSYSEPLTEKTSLFTIQITSGTIPPKSQISNL